jgi:hypothetical protein
VLSFYQEEKNPLYPLDRSLGGPQSLSGRYGEVNILALPGLEIRPLGRPACCQSIHRLSYHGSYYTFVFVDKKTSAIQIELFNIDDRLGNAFK